MSRKNLKIGIALSGGGIRATIFHLGIFQYLAEENLLESVKSVSSVSGASLCIGLILAKNSLRWPSSGEFLNKVLPAIEETLLENDIQKSALLQLPFKPQYWLNRVELAARVMEKKWGIYGSMQDLPKTPYWEINCTTFETGKSFRLRRDYMGDYKTGYVQKPELLISDVIAASAGFPILIGPRKIDANQYQWSEDKWGQRPKEPISDTYHLWDGGVYDNLGLEALYKIGGGLDSEINYLIVGDASAPINLVRRKKNISGANLKRLLDIAMDQVGALRRRDVNSYIMMPRQGLFVKIGKSAEEIMEKGAMEPQIRKELIASCMTPEEALKVQNYATTLSTPSKENFRLILRHGYENAKCTYACFFDRQYAKA